jgi:hypothetical protein
VALLAKCAYSINGRVLTDENKFDLFELFMGTSKPLKRRLYFNLLHLINRSKVAFDYLEAFCYENESRVYWKIWKAQNHFGFCPVRNKDQLTDIQVSWVLWNTSEDERLAQRDNWDRSLLVASAFNGGVNKIRSKWESSDQEEEEYREKVKAHARAGNPLDRQSPQARRKSKVKTEADLREEMRRWVEGEEDEHDVAIREYKENMRRRIRENEERVQRMREDTKKRRESLSDTSLISQPIIGLTDDQVAKLKGNRSYIHTDEFSERNDHVMSRYILAEESSGKLAVNTQGDIITKQETLMDKIQKRTPTIKD